ncbi:hypothetical protein DNTS_024163 [Danionella cerebrum]|uniref:Histidine decarboxylase n=1 Tax=Danionella cerebrum TaxID=2873325 RepID=A0A553RII2_9TELE|nr:hypothetical protein DNTS_024163 [Danionella translucida]
MARLGPSPSHSSITSTETLSRPVAGIIPAPPLSTLTCWCEVLGRRLTGRCCTLSDIKVKQTCGASLSLAQALSALLMEGEEAQEYTLRGFSNECCLCPGKEMVEFIHQYLSQIRERRVVPDVRPGFLRTQLPNIAPAEPEEWSVIMRDVENIILPGVRAGGSKKWLSFSEKKSTRVSPSSQVVHWQSPHMHAYFPALNSWPSLLGDMLSDAINCLGFTWGRMSAAAPRCLSRCDKPRVPRCGCWRRSPSFTRRPSPLHRAREDGASNHLLQSINRLYRSDGNSSHAAPTRHSSPRRVAAFFPFRKMPARPRAPFPAPQSWNEPVSPSAGGNQAREG